MGAKSGGKVRVSEYYIALHIGVAAYGRGIEMLNLKIGEKLAWKGRLIQNDVVRVDKLSLFGGNKKEGGVKGLLWWLNGNENQRLPAALANRLNLSMESCPGFRGLASFFLTGVKTNSIAGLAYQWPNFGNAVGNAFAPLPQLLPALRNGRGGFLMGSNNPYLKKISGRFRRAPQGLNPNIALIRLPDSSTGDPQFAANPAHIVFESMTDQSWGMGENWGAFDIASFEDCAATLYSENFGINILWNRQSKIQDFVKEVLDHVQGAIFVNPATGKHTMKLLRGDYDAESLQQINPDNARLSSFKRKVWGEISNEVVVTWTNPETGKESTVTAQDLGGIAAQGGVSSSSRNYHGIGSRELAQRVAERDLAAMVHPIITCDAEVTRAFWRSIPYGVVELSWPEKGIDRAICRISKVSRGESSRTVKLSLYEDVFSLDKATYLEPEDSTWVNPSMPPTPLESVYLGTAPAFMMAASLGLEDPSDIVYPEAMSLLLAPPDTTDDVGYELVTYVTNTVGEMTTTTLGDRMINGTWITNEAWAAEPRTSIPIPTVLGPEPLRGDFLMIAGLDDTQTEICVVRQITEDAYVIDRGMLDTVPQAWASGHRVYVAPAASASPDDTRRAAGEQVRYHLLTQTSQGKLDILDAPEIDTTLTMRPHLPLRPADVRIGGVGFGEAFLSGGASTEITWANRNRAEESTQALLWTDLSVTPEAGQTTSIIVTDPVTGELITTVTGLTGTSYTFNASQMAGRARVMIELVAVRDGLVSLQGHSIALNA